MPPENPQDEIPEYDRRTIIKAVTMGLVAMIVVGGLFLLIKAQFASPDPGKHYGSVADAARHVVMFKSPRPAPTNTITEYVPLDARTNRRVETAFSDFKGRPTFVVLWATWCRPCHAEMAELDRIAPEMARLGLTIVPIMTADKAGIDGARFFYRGNDIKNLPIFLDHGDRTLGAFGVGNLPVGGFITAEGELIALTDNLDLTQEPAKELLRIFATTGKLPL